MRAIGIVTFDVVVDVIQYPIYFGLKIVVLQFLGLVVLNEFQKMLVLWSAKEFTVLSVVGIYNALDLLYNFISHVQ